MVINFQEFDNLMNANTNRPSLKRGSDSLNRPVNMRFKICLLGDGAVGKTSLVRRFVKNMFTDDYIITVGTKTSKKKLIIKRPEFNRIFYLTLMIWDVMGQRRFRRLLHPNYLKGAKGAILVCDLTRMDTLEHLDEWLDILNVEGKALPSVFVANKTDLGDRSAFGQSEMKSVASAYGFPFSLTSAKTGENVENAFYTLGEKIIENMAVENPTFE